jgi:HEAT repeat protein
LLNDDSVGVRRTAGDALSDLGDASAQGAVCKALGDANKLVRWRAARFLAELGDENAVPFLQGASEDSEFEVRLEIQAALARIAGGKEGSVPAWKRILGTDY